MRVVRAPEGAAGHGYNWYVPPVHRHSLNGRTRVRVYGVGGCGVYGEAVGSGGGGIGCRLVRTGSQGGKAAM